MFLSGDFPFPPFLPHVSSEFCGEEELSFLPYMFSCSWVSIFTLDILCVITQSLIKPCEPTSNIEFLKSHLFSFPLSEVKIGRIMQKSKLFYSKVFTLKFFLSDLKVS